MVLLKKSQPRQECHHKPLECSAKPELDWLGNCQPTPALPQPQVQNPVVGGRARLTGFLLSCCLR